jgi:hypothetical protein
VKLDVFNHLFPKRYYERMLEVAPRGKDMHKRVREIPQSSCKNEPRNAPSNLFGSVSGLAGLMSYSKGGRSRWETSRPLR